MGYILPVNSYQSQQYANRIMAFDEIAEIPRLHRINMNTDFLQVLDRTIISKRSLALSNSQSNIQGNIYPNQANLSPEIAHVIGKGIAINTYV